jgi:hypothetical protein
MRARSTFVCPINPVSGLDGPAPSWRGMRQAGSASRAASIARFIAIGSSACAIAEFSNTVSQPSSV